MCKCDKIDECDVIDKVYQNGLEHGRGQGRAAAEALVMKEAHSEFDKKHDIFARFLRELAKEIDDL